MSHKKQARRAKFAARQKRIRAQCAKWWVPMNTDEISKLFYEAMRQLRGNSPGPTEPVAAIRGTT